MQLELEQVATTQTTGPDYSLFDEKEERIDASFAMAIASLVLWFLSALVLCSQQAKLRSLEARQNQIPPPEQAKKKGRHAVIITTTVLLRNLSADGDTRGHEA
jgi:hypothetical protein